MANINDEQFATVVIGMCDGKAFPVLVSHKMINSVGFRWEDLIQGIQQPKKAGASITPGALFKKSTTRRTR